VSERPSAGVRFVVTRVPEAPSNALIYRGFAHTPSADWPVEVRLDDTAKGSATVEGDLGDSERAALASAALRLVRAAAKGERPPRKIVRWRDLA